MVWILLNLNSIAFWFTWIPRFKESPQQLLGSQSTPTISNTITTSFHFYFIFFNLYTINFNVSYFCFYM